MPKSLRSGQPGNRHLAWDALMVAAQGGDSTAYRKLLSEIDVWLRRYYSQRLSSCMIDDVTQDVLLAIHAKRHTYDPDRPFIAWLAAIAHYKWVDAIRSLQSNATEPLDDEMAIPADETILMNAWSLNRLLATLKPAQAEVIRLVRLEGHTIEEASQATGQSISLVKVNIHRGLKRLAAFLRDNP